MDALSGASKVFLAFFFFARVVEGGRGIDVFGGVQIFRSGGREGCCMCAWFIFLLVISNG